MTRRERLEARLEKREEWAAKRRAAVEAVAKEGEKYRGDVAFNTQPGHIPERARLIRHQERAYEDLKVAHHHEGKADGLARQLDKSVFSDDEDAIDRLEARAAENEAECERMAAVNKAYRKYDTKGDASGLVALGVSEVAAANMKRDLNLPGTWDHKPYATYQLTNLRARVRADRERIKVLRARQARQEKAEAAGGVLIEDVGGEFACVTFSEKPSREILDALKANGFWWSGASWCGPKAKLPECVGVLEGGIPQSVQESRSGCASCLWHGIECAAGSLYQPKSETDEACDKWMYFD